MQHLAVVGQAVGGVVEAASEGPRGVVVDQLDGDLADPQAGRGGLHPELHGHGIAIVVERELRDRGDAESLEPAEGVGDGPADQVGEAVVELGGDLEVDLATLRGRGVGVGEIEVAGAGDDIEVVTAGGFDEHRDGVGLVLLVAVHGDEPVVALVGGVGEGVAEAAAVAGVGLVVDDGEAQFGGEAIEEGGRAVRGAIVDDEDIVGVAADAAEDALGVLLLVVDGDGDQGAHEVGALLWPGAGGDGLTHHAAWQKSRSGCLTTEQG